MINKTTVNTPSPAEYFLDGGFLLNKETGDIIELANPASYLVVYKNQVGSDGKVMLGRVAKDGKLFWRLNTNLTDWLDWKYTGNHIFIFGNNKKELSDSYCSLVLSVNTISGKVSQYDYLDDKGSEINN